MAYRTNKFGENVEVESGKCGTCSRYLFEREDDSNKCDKYGRWLDCDDSCSQWENFEGSSGCYLTTACCEYKGLSDDCHELQVLRGFRDEYLANTIAGSALIAAYYDSAPKILERINGSAQKNSVLEQIYDKVLKIVRLVEEGQKEKAIAEYVLMTLEIEETL